jgi:hypothetical protein
LLLHFGHRTFAASCSLMVSVRSNDLPHSLQRYGRWARRFSISNNRDEKPNAFAKQAYVVGSEAGSFGRSRSWAIARLWPWRNLTNKGRIYA